MARIHAVLGRTTTTARRLCFDALGIDLAARIVRVHGVAKMMPAREFDLLVFVASHPGEVFSREQVLTYVWKCQRNGNKPRP